MNIVEVVGCYTSSRLGREVIIIETFLLVDFIYKIFVLYWIISM